ncbi:MAG TPA: RluA family pseudouridine synthase [bacterium]
MARVYELLTGRAEAGLRLDQYLGRHLPEVLSRTVVQRAIRAQQVTVDGRPAKAHLKLRGGERIRAEFTALPPRPERMPSVPQDLPLEVVHEDGAVLVVNKPAGMVTHPAPGHWDGTLVNAILGYYVKAQQARESAPEPLPRAGIVHRLDKDTSGLLLVAKTARARLALAKQLKARTLSREYLALAEGHLARDAGTIEAGIARHATHRKTMSVRMLGGRHAVTHFRVLARLAIHTLPCTLLHLRLGTGRTHQIRVHLAHVGHPVAGDTTYGRRSASDWQGRGIGRQQLHAFRLTFRHPSTGAPVAVTALPPPDMAAYCPAPLLDRI